MFANNLIKPAAFAIHLRCGEIRLMITNNLIKPTNGVDLKDYSLEHSVNLHNLQESAIKSSTAQREILDMSPYFSSQCHTIQLLDNRV